MFGTWGNALITLVVLIAGAKLLSVVIGWAVIHAVWTVGEQAGGQFDLTSCEQVKGIGACWPAVSLRWRFLLFGRYPASEIWRPAFFMLSIVAAFSYSIFVRGRRSGLLPMWVAVPVGGLILLHGGILGLDTVPFDAWGGLTLSFVIATTAILGAIPIGMVVALMRVGAPRGVRPIISQFYVQGIRGLPLLSILFMANFLLPLLLPEWIVPSALIRAIIAITVFASAYFAEILRAGLEAIPKGQFEAAAALGLPRWLYTWKIIIPQAVRLVAGPMVNTSVATLKDTSLVLVIGIPDLFGIAQSSISDPQWADYYIEIYLAVAILYFGIAYAMSMIGARLERNR